MQKVILSKSDIEFLIEQKLLELLHDPDSGLHLDKLFVKKLKSRLKAREPRVSHKKIIEKYGRG